MARNFGIPNADRVGFHMRHVTPLPHRRPPSAFRRAAVILGKGATVAALAVSFGLLIAGWIAS